MGLSFSIPRGVKVPPSLINIYKALENDPNVSFKRPAPIHGDLSKWAKQGVMLLNAALTVKHGKSNSHKACGRLSGQARVECIHRGSDLSHFLEKEGCCVYALG